MTKKKVTVLQEHQCSPATMPFDFVHS